MSLFFLYETLDKILHIYLEEKPTYTKCYIPKFDIWDKSIDKYVSKDCDVKKCNNTYENIYYTLKNSVLQLSSKALNENICFYACAYPVGDDSYEVDLYSEVKKSVVLDCDTFTIYCQDKEKKIIFEDVYFHIRSINISRQESPDFLKPNYMLTKNRKKYNLLLYIIDSLSYYQAKRKFTNTRNVFKDKYEGIEFSLLNRVGENSRPNAYGFLMNKNDQNILDIFGIKPTIINDFGKSNPCNLVLDNTTYILELYKKMGYVTLNAEDYFYGGVFHWYNCKAFKKKSADHTFRPFQLLRQSVKYKNLVNTMMDKRCLYDGLYMLDYFKKFSEKYLDEPYASIIWGSTLMHDKIDGICKADEFLQNFFNENINLFNNTFILIMGDHGSRVGEYQGTEIGEYEVNNPYLMLSVPVELRNNKQLMNNLRKNSNKHISHMDIYATMFDILTEASRNNFKDFGEFDLSSTANFKIKGQSLLRPLPVENRSCYELNVPTEFCLCQLNFSALSSITNEEISNLKNVFVYEINKNIIENNLTDKCAIRILNNETTFFTSKVSFKNETIAYKVKGYVLPGRGYFSSMFDRNFTKLNTNLLRLNSYGNESNKCLYEQPNSKFCYCKELLKKK